MKRSKQRRRNDVEQLTRELGWQPACNGHLALSGWRMLRRPTDVDPYLFLDVRSATRAIQIAVSPTGRSVRIFVDGNEIEALA